MKPSRWFGLLLISVFAALHLGVMPASTETDVRPAGCLLPEQVSLATIRTMLEQEGWKVSDDDKGLKLTDGKGHTVVVHWQKDGKLISLVSWFKFKTLTSKSKKLQLANDINREVAFTRAAIDDDGDLRFDYWMDLNQGVCRPQLGGATRTFIAASDAALRLQDQADLIK